jgi:hypothetical protein
LKWFKPETLWIFCTLKFQVSTILHKSLTSGSGFYFFWPCQPEKQPNRPWENPYTYGPAGAGFIKIPVPVMKKKARKRMIETLGVAIFLLEAAELGVVLWEKYRSTPAKANPVKTGNRQVDAPAS